MAGRRVKAPYGSGPVEGSIGAGGSFCRCRRWLEALDVEIECEFVRVRS